MTSVLSRAAAGLTCSAAISPAPGLDSARIAARAARHGEKQALARMRRGPSDDVISSTGDPDCAGLHRIAIAVLGIDSHTPRGDASSAALMTLPGSTPRMPAARG
ncbi:MAG: hypothetical protein WKF75_08130 [Singulisphaera sp.]